MNKVLTLTVVALLIGIGIMDLARTQDYRDYCTGKGQSLVTVQRGNIICK